MERRANCLQLTLELDPLHEPISGSVIDPRGRRQTFSGWLDLMDVLERLRQRADIQLADHATNQSVEKQSTLASLGGADDGP
jgi:hypothetical protein